MKLLVVLSVLVAAAAAEDQKAEEALLYSTYAAHPLGYTTGYPYTYTTPAVYSSAYHAVPYSGLYNSVYHGYTSPVIHSLKKRDTAAVEEDQKGDEATIVSTYTGLPLAYNAGYHPYTYAAPAVYSSAYHTVPYSGLYNSVYHGYTSPVIHSLKKRDTAAVEEDQESDDSLLYSTYAAHPLAYPAGYSYTHAPVAYSAYSAYTPASTAPLAYSAALPYAYHRFY